MSAEILFLAHRIPFPPDRGDKIRSYNVLKALAALAPVHVGCLAESEADRRQEGQLAGLATSYHLATQRRPLALAGLAALLNGEPVSLAAFRNASLHDWVRQTLATRPIRAIYVFSGQMGQYVPAGWQGRLVLDLVDVDSAKFEAYGQGRSTVRGWIDRREGALLRQVEGALAARANVTLLVSEPEAALLRDRAPGGRDIRALRNGIDCARYDPGQTEPEPRLRAGAGPHIVFTGQMDYPPNVAAVVRFAKSIFPEIRARHPQAQFHIVGRAPAAQVRRLAAGEGVEVTGAVPDTRPWLAGANLVVAPLEIARGVQNKVLEAMAMARPVLASAQAATGIDAVHGEHLLICHTDDAFVREALALLEWPADGDRIGEAARKHVASTMSWPVTLAPLPGLLGFDRGLRICRDAA